MKNVAEIKVSGAGVLVRGALVDWATLRAAAKQEDAELRAVYSQILDRAEQIALSESPVEVIYGTDSTHVWYHAWPRTVWGGVGFPRQRGGMTIVAADEGGSLSHAHLARAEAEDIAARIRKIWPTKTVSILREDG